MHDGMRTPVRKRHRLEGDFATRPLQCQIGGSTQRFRLRNHRVFRQARLIKPLFHLRLTDLARIPVQEVLLQIAKKLFTGNGLKPEMSEVGGQEFVENIPTECMFQVFQQELAFLVIHRAPLFLDVLAAEPRRQGLHLGLDIGELLDQFPVIDDPFFVSSFFAKKHFHQALVQVAGDAFVQPDAAPGLVADQVPRPGMGKLVGDQRYQAAIAGEDSRRNK